jgi:hypothetical protein
MRWAESSSSRGVFFPLHGTSQWTSIVNYSYPSAKRIREGQGARDNCKWALYKTSAMVRSSRPLGVGALEGSVLRAVLGRVGPDWRKCVTGGGPSQGMLGPQPRPFYICFQVTVRWAFAAARAHSLTIVCCSSDTSKAGVVSGLKPLKPRAKMNPSFLRSFLGSFLGYLGCSGTAMRRWLNTISIWEAKRRGLPAKRNHRNTRERRGEQTYPSHTSVMNAEWFCKTVGSGGGGGPAYGAGQAELRHL